MSFTLQEVGLPGLNATAAKLATPYNINAAPDRVTYDPLSVTYMCDESLLAFRELYSWMIGISGGHDRQPLTAQFVREQSELVWPDDRPEARLPRMSSTYAALTIVSGAKVPIMRVVFHNVYPITLGPVQFSTTQDPLIPATGTATFTYDYYTIVDIT